MKLKKKKILKRIFKALNRLDKNSDRIWTITFAGDGSGWISYDQVEVCTFDSLEGCIRIIKNIQKPYYQCAAEEIEKEDS